MWEHNLEGGDLVPSGHMCLLVPSSRSHVKDPDPILL